MKKVEAVILDWAGTVVDFGSFAPTQIFVEAFKKEYAFDITLDEARGPMGLGKWDHIDNLLKQKSINERWKAQFKREPSKEDVDNIYNTFLPLQKEKVSDFSSLILGAKEAINSLKEKGIKIGSCSGYPRVVLDVLISAAAKNGYQPDCVIASDDLNGSRPLPTMALKNAIELKVSDVAHCVKVDDSAPGIYEGKSAGMWTVALLLSGNEAGFTQEGFLNASVQEKEEAREIAKKAFLPSAPHYSIDTIADLPAVIDKINKRIESGERP